MKILIPIVALVLTTSPSFANTHKQIKKDFDFICKTQKKFLKKAEKPNADQAALAEQKAKAIDKRIQSVEAKNAVKAIVQADPTQKQQLFEQAAAQAGLKNWTCPELATF